MIQLEVTGIVFNSTSVFIKTFLLLGLYRLKLLFLAVSDVAYGRFSRYKKLFV